MAKGPLMTPEIEAQIAKLYKDHPKWKAPEIRNFMERQLRETNPKLPKGWPGLSVVQKTLATVRKNIQAINPEDRPWSIGTLDDYPIPPEALPKVLEAYKDHTTKGIDLTIREAKWVVRLSATQYSIPGLPFIIARTELLYELIGKSPHFEYYDRFLAGLTAGGDWQMPFMATASLAGILKIDIVEEAKNARKHKAKRQK